MYKLLIVDDEALEREAIKYIVRNCSLDIGEIREAANGQEAVAVAADFSPDIITLDIRMPGLNGIEAGKIIKGYNPDIKIIFVTAYESFEYAHEAIKIGVEDFIVKPASDERTIGILRDCIFQLEKERQRQELKRKMEIKMNQISGFLENEYVNSVVNGEIDEQQAEDYLKFMMDEFNEGFGVVVEIDIHDDKDISYLHRNMIKKRFNKKLSKLLERNMKFMVNQVKSTIFILVFGYKPDNRVMVRRLMEDKIQMAAEAFEDQLNAVVYYGMGECFDQISLLWKSFSQAKVAARNMLLDMTDIQDNGEYRGIDLELRENELCAAILRENESEAIKQADDILDFIVFATNDINASRLKLYEFFILMNRYLSHDYQVKHAIPEYLFDDLKNIRTRGEAKHYVHKYLFEVLETLKTQNASKEPLLEEKIVRYIEKHLGEGITLEDAASEIGFSTYYFGKVFKKTFNMTFTEYLTNARIMKAKQYLKDDSITVKDVTYQVGYMDPNYFTRVFKKYVGLTPTEYRANTLGM